MKTLMTENALPPPPAERPSPSLFFAGAVVAVEGADGLLVDQRTLAGLEALDDTVFEALNGSAAALDRAADLWREIRRSAPESLVDESREQYVRRALAITDEYAVRPVATLGRRFAALEVLAMMAE